MVLIFSWHGFLKYSIWQGWKQFENHNYTVAIPHLERVVKMYPKPIGRFHIALGEMYLKNGEIEKAQKHAKMAQEINPDHNAPKELLNNIICNNLSK